jgi:hypothetical protein
VLQCGIRAFIFNTKPAWARVDTKKLKLQIKISEDVSKLFVEISQVKLGKVPGKFGEIELRD